MRALVASREPTWVREARDAYYAPLHRRRKLEDRIGRTDAGLEWIYRVRTTGKARG